MEQFFGRDTGSTSVYRWVRELTEKADEVLRLMKVDTGRVWVADEVAIKVGGKNYWLFNVMDSQTRFLLAAYLSPTRTTRPSRSRRMVWHLTGMRCRGLFQPIQCGTSSARASRRRLTTTYPKGFRELSGIGIRR